MLPQRKTEGERKREKSRDCGVCTEAAGAWAERCGAARPGGRELRLEPRCTARRGEEPDGTPSPKESRRGEGRPAETEAARQATGRGDGAGAVGSARAHLVASARSCPSPLSVDKRTLQKGGNLSNNNNRQQDLPPVLPSSLPPRRGQPLLPPPPGPPRAPSASQPAE